MPVSIRKKAAVLGEKPTAAAQVAQQAAVQEAQAKALKTIAVKDAKREKRLVNNAEVLMKGAVGNPAGPGYTDETHMDIRKNLTKRPRR